MNQSIIQQKQRVLCGKTAPFFIADITGLTIEKIKTL